VEKRANVVSGQQYQLEKCHAHAGSRAPGKNRTESYTTALNVMF